MQTYSKDFLSYGKDYTISFGNQILTLGRGKLAVGSRLPDTKGLVTPSLTAPYFIKGKRKLILTVPSIDTPVCERQIKAISSNVDDYYNQTGREVYVVSVDTPFAQARFIKDNNINDRINFISAYVDHNFLYTSGLCVLELNVFARSAVECDESDIVTNVYITKDITHIPSIEYM